MEKRNEYIENLNKNFNEDEFKELDEAFGGLIREGTYDNDLYWVSERCILDWKEFVIGISKLGKGMDPDFGDLEKMKNEKSILESSLIPFIELCENHKIEFSKTSVFKELVKRYKDTELAEVLEKMGVDMKS